MNRGKRGLNKSGLSTIIVTLILIVISLAAIGVFWLVINNVIKGGSEQIGLDRFIVDAEIKNVGTDNNTNNVSLTFKRKAGSGDMTGIKFVFTDGFNTEIATEEFTLKELEEKKFIFHLTKLLVDNLLTISIVPVIKTDDGDEIIGNTLGVYNVKKGNYQAGTTTPAECVPATCTGLGYNCGTHLNGSCAGSLSCGSCSSGYTCTNGLCVAEGACTPVTNPCGSAVCGTATNGTCGDVSCGTCGSGYSCVGGSCVLPTAYTCGNNILEPGEACDGTNMSGYNCASFPGFVSGSLSCNSDCKRYITTSCVAGNTINAISCSQSDVQNAINSASDGDTVNVPAGDCNWTTAISITNRNIFLNGSGMYKTVFSWGNPTGTPLSFSGSTFRISNIGINVYETSGTTTALTVRGSVNWRVDHCLFNNTDTELDPIEAVFVRGAVPNKGVIDHNTLLDTRINVISATLMAYDIWYEPLGLGTYNAPFIESNYFSRHGNHNVIDSQYGGRYIFRNNYVKDGDLEVHSATTSGRAGRSWEIYNNIIAQQDYTTYMAFRIRGGTGVIFNNSVIGSFDLTGIGLDNVRTYEGTCNGTSTWDGNIESNGYWCRDQIGRSTDAYLGTSMDTMAAQELDPAYEWNNTINGVDLDFLVINNCEDHIQENRDYYNDIEKPGYVSYPYPHPLTLID